MSKRERNLKVEAVTYSDTLETLVDRHFQGRPVHRVEDTGAYNVSRIIEQYGHKLLRSRQEYLPTPSGFSNQLEWASLCVQLEEDLFIIILAKGSSSVRSNTGNDEYKVTVASGSYQKAASALSDLRGKFLCKSGVDGPSFFIMTGPRRAQPAPLEPKHLLDPSLLAMHYGQEFSEWVPEFLKNLCEPGISILRGEAGTGKTSFLRHSMCSLSNTCPKARTR